jgi:hypothetical protein
VLLAELE